MKVGFANADINNEDSLSLAIDTISAETKCSKEMCRDALLKYNCNTDLAIVWLTHKTYNGRYFSTAEEKILKLQEILKNEYDNRKEGYEISMKSPYESSHPLNLNLSKPFTEFKRIISTLAFAGIIEENAIIANDK